MSNTQHRNGETLSLADYAAAHGCVRSTATRWKQAGYLTMRGDEVLVAPSDAVLREQGLGRFRGQPQDATPTWSDARRRKELALAEKHELDIRIRLGEVVSKEAMQTAGGKLLDVLRSNIVALEGRWATQFPGTEPRIAAVVLNRMIRELLEHLSGPTADALQRREPAPLLPAREAELPEAWPGRAALMAADVRTIGDLLATPDLRAISGIGPKTEQKILEALEAHDAA